MSVSPPLRLVIATRASRLALWQAHHVQARLQSLYPDCQVELLEMTTRGDQILDRTLSKVGGKGLFVKELETALLDGRADLAVHSLKDVPVDLGQPFELAAILDRADPYDALVSNTVASLDELPAGAVLGTSSLRREAQLRARYPELQVRPLRGNLDTRLAKLDRGEYAAIVLAAAGLQRLDLAQRIRAVLPVDLSLPAAGQGALGIETLASRTELRTWLAPLANLQDSACTLAERAVSRTLGGSCQVPLAAYAILQDDQLFLRALVAEPDGSRVLRAEIHGAIDQAESLGVLVARDLIAQGADQILARLSI
ncbi:hydroxymethylbilane synthase [Castellaniella sp.]|uniref:hydroxymethylbilane synthase n=1 Tax=Castellaniella sp. TaxID=1955812 RepID=UPI002B000DAD|nr:hydroxymethylbilane synthase [Castellaniella sp.]